jgi:plastocyanin domain-containing protein
VYPDGVPSSADIQAAATRRARQLVWGIRVSVEFTPDKTGEIAFICGMNMLRGAVVVR